MTAEDALKHTELLDRYIKPAVTVIAEKIEEDFMRVFAQHEALRDGKEENTLP